MGQVLRITFLNKDYSFEILNHSPLSQEREEIHIRLDGLSHTLVSRNGQWLPKDDHELVQNGLAEAIGRVISLRYRI
jgi:hypothetical protein